MELDWSQGKSSNSIKKVESSGSLRQQTSKEHVEENTGGDTKADNDLERHGEESSRLCSVARYCWWPVFFE